ncbi:hypothetical protein Glove_69g36 [Diversispora epigaea]|uniref:Uncharacterized protein n=1 Tax=Diversispora epigaea TaxID=1348612 RepID=A0A397JJT2_9GLOM|nr:hypothetical protein Glove_69g36 [Diversispora epigaea]
MLRAAGSYNITSWTNVKSEYQFWTKSSQFEYECAMLKQLYQMGFLISIPIHMPNTTKTFWNCFRQTLDDNKQNCDGKRRILSIVADKFTYAELKSNLNVGDHTILESRKHAQLNGYGAPPLIKPIINRVKLKEENIKQFESFFADKKNVNMSLYKSDNKTGLPILYLQDHKQALWKKFHEQYPDGMQRTSFMTRLEDGRFQYKEDLEGLCMMCNEYGYLVFSEIEKIIDINIIDSNIQKELTNELQFIRRYLRRDFSKKLQIDNLGNAIHNSCISHCLKYAFEYQKQLISFMSHHARKSYLNAQLNSKLYQLDSEGALLIVDYKMKILLKSARETKSEFFGKRGWSLHSILAYTKDIETNNFNIQAYNHWSNDTKQDAWFTASSLHGVIETLEKKPKWITIISDNGPHYHNTELMIILSYWKEWYNITGEAKTAIDSHHAQITHAIKRYVKLGFDITSGENIKDAIKDLVGTYVAHIQPDRSQNQVINKKLGTIQGITNWAEWMWPIEENDAGYIYGRALPGFGTWNKFSPHKIQKISKERTFVRPNPTITQHTKPNKT